MGPTASLILSIDPNTYLAPVSSWKQTAATLESRTETFKGYVDKPGGTYWEGEFAEAAQHNAGDGLKTVGSIRDTVDALSDEVTGTVTYSVLPPLNTAKAIINHAQRQPGVTVNDDLSMTYTPPKGVSDEAADKSRAAVALMAKELKDNADKWWAATQTVKTQIEVAEKTIGGQLNLAAATFNVHNAIVETPVHAADATQGGNLYKGWYPKESEPGNTHAAAATAVDPNAPVLGPPSPETKPGDGKSTTPVGSFTGQIQTITDPNKPPAKPVYDPKKVGSFGGAVDFVHENSTPIPEPEPAFGEEMAKRIQAGFNESLDGTIQGAKNLVGLGGEGAPGVAESWGDLAKGTGETILKRGLVPMAGMIEDAQHAIKDPGHFAGQKLFDGVSTVAGGVVGGEAAALRHGLLEGIDSPGVPHTTVEPPASTTHSTPGVDYPSPTVDHPAPSADHSMHDYQSPHFAPLPDTGPYPLPERAQLATPSDGAFFWSGRNGDGTGIGPVSAGGNGAADLIADGSRATTLEGLLASKGIEPPKWSPTDTYAQKWWDGTSQMYAESSSGEVRAVIGSNLRPGNVWQTVELPRLMENPNVRRVVVIDPDTGIETIVFQR